MIKSDWRETPVPSEPPAGLPALKADPGAVTFEVDFVSVLTDARPKDSETDLISDTGSQLSPAVQPNAIEEIWHCVDETVIAPEIRRELGSNGLRVGRVHTRSEFQRSLDLARRTPVDEAARFLDSAQVGSDLLHSSRKIPCRAGKKYELPVRNPVVGDVTTLVSLQGNAIGRTLANPQYQFSVFVQNPGASGVQVRLKPEILHGESRQTWVGSDSALRIDNRRESWEFDDLAIDLSLAYDDILVVGAKLPPVGLGAQMFTGKTADGAVDHVLMVIQLTDLPRLMAK